MKKLIFICLSTLLLTGCLEEKSEFQQAIFEELKADKDIADYSLDPDEMSRCVFDTASAKMPGFFSFEPQRQPIYAGYTKLIKLKTVDNPEATLKELHKIFGPGDAVAKAQRNYSESVFECFQNLVSKTDPGTDIDLGS